MTGTTESLRLILQSIIYAREQLETEYDQMYRMCPECESMISQDNSALLSIDNQLAEAEVLCTNLVQEQEVK